MVQQRFMGWGRRLAALCVLGTTWCLGRFLGGELAIAGLTLGALGTLWGLERWRHVVRSQAQLEERKRLSAELHDGVATRLASLS